MKTKKKGELHDNGVDVELHRQLGSFDNEPSCKKPRKKKDAPTPVGDPLSDPANISLPNLALGLTEEQEEDLASVAPNASPWVLLDLSDERIEGIVLALAAQQFPPDQLNVLHHLQANGPTPHVGLMQAQTSAGHPQLISPTVTPLLHGGLIQQQQIPGVGHGYSMTPAGTQALQQHMQASGQAQGHGGPSAPPTPSQPGLGGAGAFHTGGTHRVQGGTAKNPTQAYHYEAGASQGGTGYAPPGGSVKDSSGGLLSGFASAALHNLAAGTPSVGKRASPITPGTQTETDLMNSGYITADPASMEHHVTKAGLDALQAAGGVTHSQTANWKHTLTGQGVTSLNVGQTKQNPTNESKSGQRAYSAAFDAQDVVNTLVAQYAGQPKHGSIAIQHDPAFVDALTELNKACTALNSQYANSKSTTGHAPAGITPQKIAQNKQELDHYRVVRDAIKDAAARGLGLKIASPASAPFPIAAQALGQPIAAPPPPAQAPAPALAVTPPSTSSPAAPTSPAVAPPAAQQAPPAATPPTWNSLSSDERDHLVSILNGHDTVSKIVSHLGAHSLTSPSVITTSRTLVKLGGLGLTTYHQGTQTTLPKYGLTAPAMSLLAANGYPAPNAASAQAPAAAPPAPAPAPAAVAPVAPAPPSPPALSPDEQKVLNYLTNSKRAANGLHFNSMRTGNVLGNQGSLTTTNQLLPIVQSLVQKGLVSQHSMSAGKQLQQSVLMATGASGQSAMTPHATPAPASTPPAPQGFSAQTPSQPQPQGMTGVFNPPTPGSYSVGPNSSYIHTGAAAGLLPGAPVYTKALRTGRSTLPMDLSNQGPMPGSKPYTDAQQYPDRNHAAAFGMNYQGATGNIVTIWHGSSKPSLAGATVSGLRPGGTNAYGYGIYCWADKLQPGIGAGYANDCNYQMELHTGQCVHHDQIGSTSQPGSLIHTFSKKHPALFKQLQHDNARLKAAAAIDAGFSCIVNTWGGSTDPFYVVLDPTRCRIKAVTDNKGAPLTLPNGKKSPPPLPGSIKGSGAVKPAPDALGLGTSIYANAPATAWFGTPDFAAAKDPTLTHRNAAVGADPNVPLSDNGFNLIKKIGASMPSSKMSKARIDEGRDIARMIRPVRGVDNASDLLSILDSDGLISGGELQRRIAASKADPSPEGQALYKKLSSVSAKNNPDDKTLGLSDSVFLTYGAPTAFNSYGGISIVYKPEVLNTPGTKVNLHGVNSYNNKGTAPVDPKAWAENEVDGYEASEVMGFQLAAGYGIHDKAGGKASTPENGALAQPSDYLHGHQLTAREQAEVHVPTSVSHHHISHIMIPAGSSVQIGGNTSATHSHWGVAPGTYDTITKKDGSRRRADVWQQNNSGTDGQTVHMDGQQLTLRHVAQPDGTTRWQFEVPTEVGQTVPLGKHLESILRARGIDCSIVETAAGGHGKPHASVRQNYSPGGTPGGHGMHSSVYESICYGSI